MSHVPESMPKVNTGSSNSLAHILQGVESNMRHHRRYQPLIWGAQREKDHFLHYPHGGRTDSRFQTPNAVDDMEVDPDETGKATIQTGDVTALLGQKYKWGSFYPDMHYSHMLNYDYWKLDLPYVWPLFPCLNFPLIFCASSICYYCPAYMTTFS